MKEFKVGDWVRVQDSDKGYKIKSIHQNRYFFKEAISVFCKHDLTTWQPRNDEWVVCCLSETKDEFWVMKYRKEDIENLIRLNPHEEAFIEPFIGELPSFLKDKR